MRNKFEIMRYQITIRSKWSSIWLPSCNPGKTAPLADCETWQLRSDCCWRQFCCWLWTVQSKKSKSYKKGMTAWCIKTEIFRHFDFKNPPKYDDALRDPSLLKYQHILTNKDPFTLCEKKHDIIKNKMLAKLYLFALAQYIFKILSEKYWLCVIYTTNAE